MLRRLDRARGRIRFTDIAAPDFRAQDHGMTQADFMARIKARRSNGQWLDGVEVFRALYGAVGFSWAIPITRLPGISHALEWGYDLFARNRLRLTGREEACGNACLPPATSTAPQPK
jgi:predicted DCC family thiol-disulfide oxidoreductase YuxK